MHKGEREAGSTLHGRFSCREFSKLDMIHYGMACQEMTQLTRNLWRGDRQVLLYMTYLRTTLASRYSLTTSRGVARRGRMGANAPPPQNGDFRYWRSSFFSTWKTVTNLRLLSHSITNVRWLVICHCYDCAAYTKTHHVSRRMECATLPN